MIFGPTQLAEARGSILAQTVRLGPNHGNKVLKKGTVLDEAAIAALQADAPAGKSGKTSQDDLSCPACQAAALVGLVMGPSGLLLLLPGVSHVVAPVPAQLRPAPEPPTYVWRSRGPPQL